jgi:hypothetical protein
MVSGRDSEINRSDSRRGCLVLFKETIVLPPRERGGNRRLADDKRGSIV